ncbi:MAG TPA: calcium-binding protein [Pararhizobium sp.]|uniref:calcium-binding protein n=1 Tax=Pararhizobium sp. TaxID=1977563 RepID=UPI002BCD0347|nr:calcium-binding protein [Pararhizobium sp.]HTO31080.1 calcium-binding protein [Pararhizobium sp.]
MASSIFNTDSVGTGIRASLATYETAFVGLGVTVGSTDGTAINGIGDGIDINIQGTVIGQTAAIAWGTSSNFGSNLFIGKSGYVGGFATGISMAGFDGSIDNRGTIWSARTGIEINATSPDGNLKTTEINNRGTIEGETAILNKNTDALFLINTGTIEGAAYAFSSQAVAVDNIVNKGAILGDVLLGSGDDWYDGTNGLLDGTVYGGAGQDYLIGGKGADHLEGGADADDISGGGGNDYIVGDAGTDRLTGGSGNDEIHGGAAQDTIDGGTGADCMVGGSGSDLYLVDNAKDSVIEVSGGGNDVLFALVSFALEYDQSVEQMIFANLSDTVKNVVLTGNNLKQSIIGGVGNDTLNGGGGTDRLTGLIGDDTYIVDGSDTVVEAAGEGTDLVKASAAHTLAANVENLTLIGTLDFNGTGNELANIVIGNSGKNRLQGKDGDDTLNGGLGLDKLVGGLGKDSFIFDTTLAADNIDTINDFSVIDDTIRLDNAVFTALATTGMLSATAFAINLTGLAGDASDRIIFEKDTGKLFYDADGTGSAVGIQFALVTKNLVLTEADFIIT